LKAPSFAYAKPRTLAEAFDLLARPGAKILAGGQSLIPSLNMRLSAPELLVDITGFRAEVQTLRYASARFHPHEVERSPKFRTLPFAEAVRHIAHLAIRNRTLRRPGARRPGRRAPR
jgi:CO/xanthine dehydrogenase FAD-binding subunit